MLLRGRSTKLLALFAACVLIFAAAARVGEPAAPSAVALLPSPTQTPPNVLASSSPTANPTATPTLTASASPTSGPSLTPGPTLNVRLHRVQRGDSLYRIAQAYDISVEALIASNNLANPSRLEIGQGIIVPIDGTAVPSPTATFTETPVPSLTPEPTVLRLDVSDLGLVLVAEPRSLLGVPLEYFIQISDESRAHILEIYALGQSLGRNPHAYSKVGDSTIENPHFLTRFDDEGAYDLGSFAYLQRVVDHFQGSFARQGLAVRRGMHSWSLMDSLWADPAWCEPGETVVACEIRVQNPSIIIFRMGSNDVGRPDSFEANMRAAIEYAMAQGVIPIIGTKADRFDGPDSPNNLILRRLALEYALPLWDYDVIAARIPDRGLGPDRVHMTTFYAHDWTLPEAFQRGGGVHNLTALMMLDAVLEILEDAPVATPAPTVSPGSLSGAATPVATAPAG